MWWHVLPLSQDLGEPLLVLFSSPLAGVSSPTSHLHAYTRCSHLPHPSPGTPRVQDGAHPMVRGCRGLYNLIFLSRLGFFLQPMPLSPEWESLPGRCLQASLQHTQACSSLLSFYQYFDLEGSRKEKLPLSASEQQRRQEALRLLWDIALPPNELMDGGKNGG